MEYSISRILNTNHRALKRHISKRSWALAVEEGVLARLPSRSLRRAQAPELPSVLRLGLSGQPVFMFYSMIIYIKGFSRFTLQSKRWTLLWTLAQLQCCVKLSLSTNMIVNIQVSSIHIRKLLIVLNVDLVMIRFRKVVVVVIRQRVLYFSELAKSKVPQNPLTWAQSHQKSSWWSTSFIICHIHFNKEIVNLSYHFV